MKTLCITFKKVSCVTVDETWASVQFSSVQSFSHVRLFETPWITIRQASLSITISWSSFKLMSIESVMPSSHLILGRPLLLLPPIPPSIRVFSNESTLCMRWPKYCSFSFSIIPSKEIPGLISFRMDWLDLLAVQGTLNNLLQHHTSKASILQCSAFFTVHRCGLSHPYMTTGKTTALTRWTFVGKVTSLLFSISYWIVKLGVQVPQWKGAYNLAESKMDKVTQFENKHHQLFFNFYFFVLLNTFATFSHAYFFLIFLVFAF